MRALRQELASLRAGQAAADAALHNAGREHRRVEGLLRDDLASLRERLQEAEARAEGRAEANLEARVATSEHLDERATQLDAREARCPKPQPSPSRQPRALALTLALTCQPPHPNHPNPDPPPHPNPSASPLTPQHLSPLASTPHPTPEPGGRSSAGGARRALGSQGGDARQARRRGRPGARGPRQDGCAGGGAACRGARRARGGSAAARLRAAWPRG